MSEFNYERFNRNFPHRVGLPADIKGGLVEMDGLI
jgi:hypothetical protein